MLFLKIEKSWKLLNVGLFALTLKEKIVLISWFLSGTRFKNIFCLFLNYVFISYLIFAICYLNYEIDCCYLSSLLVRCSKVFKNLLNTFTCSCKKLFSVWNHLCISEIMVVIKMYINYFVYLKFVQLNFHVVLYISL